MKHSIILLETDKPSNILLCYNDYLQFDKNNGKGYVLTNVKFQYLYICSYNRLNLQQKDYAIEYLLDWTPKELFKVEGTIPGECLVRKVVASTDKSLKLPWIDDEFIQEFVKAYNAGTSITEVELEMEEFLLTTKDDILDSKGTAKHIWKPKIKSDGSVIIKI